MKPWLIALLLCGYMQAWSQTTPDQKKMEGKWMVTWVYFSSPNTPKSEGLAPFSDAIWTFKNNGKYTIRSVMQEKGKYQVNGAQLLVDSDKKQLADFDKRTYSIVALDNETLEIEFNLHLSESSFTVSHAILKRVK